MTNNKGFADPATASDLMTFTMMSDICNNIEKLERKVKVLKFKNALYLFVSISVAYYLFDGVNQKYRMLLKEKNSDNKTK